MQIKSLTLTQFRAFEQVTFEFQPGMNLLVGINGVGKSSVLDALRIALSRVLPNFTAYQDKRLNFEVDDIMMGRDQLAVKIKFQAFDIPFICNVTRGKSHKVEFKPDNENILYPLKNADEQPLVVYFSTRRSVPVEKVLNKKNSAGNQSAAFAEALIHRMLRLREFAEWWLVQDALLGEDRTLAKQRLEIMKNVVIKFLTGCTSLSAAPQPKKVSYFCILAILNGFKNLAISLIWVMKWDDSQLKTKTTLILDKDGVTINVTQLSDGERGLLALVLDLARRLCQANPNLEDPLENGKAVVLIDEIDLHLHPRWQRTIVDQLTQTFPNCQFIATTHSPLIIGEVKPPGLTLIRKEDNGIVLLEKGLQGFGLASNWILEELMGTKSRNATTQAQINLVEDALEEGELELARNRLEQLKDMIQGYDGEVVRLEASINNLEALAEDVDI
ncbi:AAA family ATPase [Dolichospermum heterosporum]|uniref:AAA family ATPase n=1 Tax=Dolichospermum heterosporum TAC447 TaxID=747523 RepID=A0ABY5LTB9_9CYAN|nr:AAA family ATPase [Dolichospermum heterosporum]UUO13798.1 AAA family ATPase [Dolichospermum heterosporum TAC447]